MRKNGKLEPASWEDALEEVARRLKQVKDKHGANAIGVIGSNHTTNEENYLLNRFARATLGTNNIDHHRTADYVGLAAALGPNAKNALGTMEDVYTAQNILLIGNDVTQQNPLVAWQIRTGVRHHAHAVVRHQRHGEQDSSPGGDRRGSRQERRTRMRLRWLATGKGNFPEREAQSLAKIKEAIEKASDVLIIFGAGIQGAAIRDLVAFGSQARRQNEVHGARRLREFARRGRYGRAARPPAGLRIACRRLRTRPLRKNLGRGNFGDARPYRSRA